MTKYRTNQRLLFKDGSTGVLSGERTIPESGEFGYDVILQNCKQIWYQEDALHELLAKDVGGPPVAKLEVGQIVRIRGGSGGAYPVLKRVYHPSGRFNYLIYMPFGNSTWLYDTELEAIPEEDVIDEHVKATLSDLRVRQVRAKNDMFTARKLYDDLDLVITTLETIYKETK